ncbi:tumor necrosis factor receptor superfamily member 14 isoform X2 [Ahaetulla prasina]|uniref:tumor necrosis factor receptor superfamily member 14 isoform X2 n=1 Tax=Ahaetulla prasina TaxID=499056 RepID=UPI002647FF79|nr:tumor necrosis factor receptor superfamily member 14 isoform X2 [Ahaetulla prasina]
MAFSLSLGIAVIGGKMTLILHIALVIHFLLLRNAFSCESWEYSIGRECCPKCGAGLRVLRHCTRATNTACIPCDSGWFTEHPNGLTMCLKCRECSPESHMQIKERCHYTKNTKCGCQPGFFCFHQLEADSCDVCVRHTTAPPGYRVTRAGTENHDVSFEACPPGTFSSKEMSFSCIKWTNCSEKGLTKTHEGTATSDVVCEDKSPRNLGLILPLVCAGLLVLLTLIVILVVWKKGKCPLKAICKKKAEEPNYRVPEKECMVTVRPIQETAPNLGQPTYASC